jgi:hypothetical protein
MLCHFGLVEETVFVYFCREKYFKKIKLFIISMYFKSF